MVGTLVIAGLCSLGVEGASAQTCSITSSTYDESHILPQLGAVTSENNYCPTDVTQTELWIRGENNIQCRVGTRVGTTVCKRTADPSMLEAYASGVGGGCGVWEGLSKHMAISNEGAFYFMNNGLPYSTDLFAARCRRGDDDPFSCEEWEMWDEQQGRCIPYNTPIIIPITQAQAIKLTNLEEGVNFDHDADGTPERTAWTAPGSRVAFLAIDRDGNGRIDSGRELFGNNTHVGAKNGFEALDLLNKELGGKTVANLDVDAPIFSKLLLWEDRNHNGISEPYELTAARDTLASIGLGLKEHRRRDGHGNLFRWRGFAQTRTAQGKNVPQSGEEDRIRTISIYDVMLRVQR